MKIVKGAVKIDINQLSQSEGLILKGTVHAQGHSECDFQANNT